jgi:hypothetical protein
MTRVARILDGLEKHYGRLKSVAPTEAYEVIYANCGYRARGRNASNVP